MRISHMIAHRVGNKLRGEGVGFSSKEIDALPFTDMFEKLFCKTFKSDDFYFFNGNHDIDANPVYSFVKSIFNNQSEFKSQSNHIAKCLYESSVHPMVKAGELCIIYMNDIEYENAIVDAVAILKCESHQEVLQFSWGENGYEAHKSSAINLSKIDKGALIYNVFSEKGYVISIVDKVRRGGDAKYWKNAFLNVKSYNGSHHQTSSLVDLCSDFVKNNVALDSSLSRLEKALIASRSKDILLYTESDSMSLKDYAAAVFKNKSIEAQFSEFVENSDHASELDVESITINKRAVSKKKNSISTIKLDDNFELYVNGAEDRISKGYDPDAALNYYKLYFEKEK